MLCIAKAYRDEPIERLVVSRAHGLTYLVNPAVAGARERIGIQGVGFPDRCVFQHDTELLRRLRDAYERQDIASLGTLWGRAKTLNGANK